MIAVEVIYCPSPGVVDARSLELPEGSTLQDALAISGVLDRHALVLDALSVGIWGRKQAAAAVLRDRDRIEVYRPLQCDPKEARRLRYRQRAAANRPPA